MHNSYSALAPFGGVFVDEEETEEETGEDTDDETEETTEEQVAQEEAIITQKIAELEKQQMDAQQNLQDLKLLFEARQKPIREELHVIGSKLDQLQEELRSVRDRHADIVPPGPSALAFVGSSGFNNLCSAVVLGNLVCMVLVMQGIGKGTNVFFVMDQLFLVWYLLELLLKLTYYQRGLLFGRLIVVWWNWLDLGIVISGVVDQWVLPLMSGHLGFDAKTLRLLRFLRLFRVARLLKILRPLLYDDMSWVEGHYFETFIMCVILLNALVMGWELDYQGWGAWFWINQLFLIIYTFEAAAKLTYLGARYFTVWSHWLDFIIVVMGIVQQWMLPFVKLVMYLFGHSQSFDNPAIQSVLSIMRMGRLLRIFRLSTFASSIRPLYRFLVGMQAGLEGMKWVLLFTILFLYLGAIILTSLVGHGLMFGGPEHVSEEATERYGTMMQSMFSLFRLMNADLSVAQDFESRSMVGKFLFVFFMVGTNWVILATLTSVLADHMIAGSSIALEQDRMVERELDYQSRSRRLRSCFQECDQRFTGCIAPDTFNRLLADPGLCQEMCAASSLTVSELKDLFFLIGDENGNINYHDFIHLCYEQRQGADKKAVVSIMAYMRDMERRLDYRLDSLGAASHLPRGSTIQHFLEPEPSFME